MSSGDSENGDTPTGGKAPQKKDLWDVFGVVSQFLSGVLIATVGLYLTHVYGQKEKEKADAEKTTEASRKAEQDKHNGRILELQTVSTFLPYLSGTNEQLREAAMRSIVKYASLEIASDMKEIFTNSPGIQQVVDDSTRKQAEIFFAKSQPGPQPTEQMPWVQSGPDYLVAINAGEPASTNRGAVVWSRNNAAQANTWALLNLLDQSKTIFSRSADVKMSNLAFWNKAGTPEERELRARSLASSLELSLTRSLNAKHEGTNTPASAQKALVRVLTNGTATMYDLAEQVDRHYRFPVESR